MEGSEIWISFRRVWISFRRTLILFRPGFDFVPTDFEFVPREGRKRAGCDREKARGVALQIMSFFRNRFGLRRVFITG
jgi:hypothetical protein